MKFLGFLVRTRTFPNIYAVYIRKSMAWKSCSIKCLHMLHDNIMLLFCAFWSAYTCCWQIHKFLLFTASANSVRKDEFSKMSIDIH